MIRKIFSPTLLTLILLAFFGGRVADKKEKAGISKKPNILFIAIDDLRPELGCYGNARIKTPNIDRFADQAVLLENTYCQSAVCAPSRASLMTGLRPDSTRVWYLGDKFRQTILDVVTMPQHFHKYGYHTICIGKIFHNYMPDSISWDEPDIRPAFYSTPEYLNRDPETFYHTEVNRERQKIKRDSIMKKVPPGKKIYADGWYMGPAFEIADLPDSSFYDGMQTDIAIKTLQRMKEKGEPFFLALGYFRPHLPFVAPKKYWDMYPPGSIPSAKNPYLPKDVPFMSEDSNYELRNYLDYEGVERPSGKSLPADSADMLKRGYYASVSYIDACLGKLFKALKETGMYDNTVIILWGDHGWKLGEHNGWGKQTNFNIDNQVPLIFKYAGQKQSVRSKALTELVDVFPTLCDLSGIDKPVYLQGASMMPLIKQPDRPWKTAVFSQFRRTAKASKDGKEYMGYSMLTKKYHYVEWYTWDNTTKQRGEFKAAELYDQQADPDENENIVVNEKNQALMKELSAELKAGWKAAMPDHILSR